MRIPALPFSSFNRTVPKPLGMKYVQEPKTFGQKLRNRRLEKRLLQKDVAAMIGVTEDAITLWENDRNLPHVSYYPKITQFLGYMPFAVDDSTLAGKMKKYRYVNGLTQEDFAKQLGIDESTVFHYEKGTHKPSKRFFFNLQKLFKSITYVS
jgi:transcriptional regulator with XRE-family HTH domain